MCLILTGTKNKAERARKIEMTRLMQGFPPPPEGQVTLANWRSPPFSRWAFQHVRELLATADIANDPANVRELESSPIDMGALRIAAGSGGKGPLSLDAFLTETSTDGIVILHRGRKVFERYTNGMTDETPHILMSVSKSMLGLLAGVLIARGALEPDRPVTDLIPEVANTAYTGATIRQLLDMRVGIAFDEDYLATSGAIVAYRKATGWNPIAAGDELSDLRSFYRQMRDTVWPHGHSFHYVSPNTDLLGWVIERAAGRRYADLMSELIWKPMGAVRSAYITVDRLGAPRCAGGMCTTVPDLARVGQLILEGGSRAGCEIIPSAWIDDIMQNGDPDAWAASSFVEYFPGVPMHYRSKWYLLRGPAPLLMGLGIHGQYLFVDKKGEIVIAKVSSQDLPLDAERISLTMRAVSCIRDWLADGVS
jgi:CubicO group peptidase (beta-lactamase class C family)